MKILILGADGMIGHKMTQTLSNYNFDIHLNSRVQKEFLEKIFPINPSVLSETIIAKIPSKNIENLNFK